MAQDEPPQPTPPPPPSQEGAGGDATEPNSSAKVQVTSKQVGSVFGDIGQAVFVSVAGPPQESQAEERPDDLPEDRPSLPPNLFPFREPRHADLIRVLERRRVLVLSSYHEMAAYSVAFTLSDDELFEDYKKEAFVSANRRSRTTLDLDFAALAREPILGSDRKILLVNIDSACPLLDSAFRLNPASTSGVCANLQNHGSYVILAVNDDLLRDLEISSRLREALPVYEVSHLRYLMASVFRDERAERFEKRFQAVISAGGLLELRELHRELTGRIIGGAGGAAEIENYLVHLEQAIQLPLAIRQEQLQPVQPPEVFREGTETHCAATFVATFLPDLGEQEFDRMVRLLLGDQEETVERTRQLARADGDVVTFREDVPERWSDRWERSSDRVFRECHLCTVASNQGPWLVDFSEPYLRRTLRNYLERNHSWYLRRQCRTLQDEGVLFSPDLSRAAEAGLIKLFVERAIVDPAGFGSRSLLGLVRGMRIQLRGNPPSDSTEDVMEWILETMAAEDHLRNLFYSRLALLLREMLAVEALRPMVEEFFELLIATRQHGALLGVVLELARRLRFAPHFDPLVWMRRLIDQRNPALREETARKLIDLARESGPQIYERLAAIHGWAPEEGRPAQSFSESNKVALDFPFAYCASVARSLPFAQLGRWPSRHPLFYALPAAEPEVRAEVGRLVEWILDPRGASLENGDDSNPLLTPEAMRVGRAADLVEQWAWVLEGKGEDASPEGRALLDVVLQELALRCNTRRASWLLRGWQRRENALLREAPGCASKEERRFLLARRTKLGDLETRFVSWREDRRQATEPAGGKEE